MTPIGTPEARNMVRNSRLDSMIKNSLCTLQLCPLHTSVLLTPPPMLYSPSHKNHADFAESFGGLCDGSRPSTFRDSCRCTRSEPPAAGNKQGNDKDGELADPPVAVARAANAHAS